MNVKNVLRTLCVGKTKIDITWQLLVSPACSVAIRPQFSKLVSVIEQQIYSPTRNSIAFLTSGPQYSSPNFIISHVKIRDGFRMIVFLHWVKT